jgi:hypothetical protein
MYAIGGANTRRSNKDEEVNPPKYSCHPKCITVEEASATMEFITGYRTLHGAFDQANSEISFDISGIVEGVWHCFFALQHDKSPVSTTRC